MTGKYGESCIGAHVTFHNSTASKAKRRIRAAEAKFNALRPTLCCRTPIHRRLKIFLLLPFSSHFFGPVNPGFLAGRQGRAMIRPKDIDMTLPTQTRCRVRNSGFPLTRFQGTRIRTARWKNGFADIARRRKTGWAILGTGKTGRNLTLTSWLPT